MVTNPLENSMQPELHDTACKTKRGRRMKEKEGEEEEREEALSCYCKVHSVN